MTRARDVANIDGLLTTTGDTYYASAAGTPARLGIGSSAQVLTVASGVPSWATPSGSSGPMFSAYMDNAGNNQAPSNNVQTKIIMDTEQYDTDSCYNTSTYRFTPNKSGYYLFTYAIATGTSNNDSNRLFVVYKNGAEPTSPYMRTWQGGTTVNATLPGSVILYANGTTDYFEMYGSIQDSTSRQFNTSYNSGSTFWQAIWMRS